ncbi:MAG: DNA circularization protein [Rhodospirillaceae bacterium]
MAVAATPYWRTEILRPASFRGIGFEEPDRRGRGGRVLAKHRFPQAETGFDEDVGGKPLAFSVSAYVIGRDYHTRRDKLLAALRQKGPGEYIDQWGGTWQVQVDDFGWVESLAEGGMARFHIEFAVYTESPQHTVTTDTGYAVGAAATPAKASAASAFSSAYSARGNAFVLSQALSEGVSLKSLLTALLSSNNAESYKSSTTVVQTQTVVTNSAVGTTEAVADAETYAATLAEMIAASLACLEAGWVRYLAAMALLDYGADFAEIAATTTARRQAAVNRALMIALVRTLAAIEAALAAAEIDFTVYDDAVAVRQALGDALDAQMLTADDDTYATLSALRAAVIRDVTERGANLAKLAEVTLSATLPALVVAYQLYGDASREGDVIDRNPSVRHPGFVPGGEALKVPNE